MYSQLKNYYSSYTQDFEENVFDFDILKSRFITSDVDFNANLELKAIYQHGKKRTVATFTESCYEEIILKYLKNRIDSEFDIKYPDRGAIMKGFFDLVETLPKLSDFIIFRFDFKDFFNSINSSDVLDDYFFNKNFFRYELDILNKLSIQFSKTYAGLPTSNSLVEVVSKRFDETLISEFMKEGMIFYSRYVDDGILVFSKFIAEENIKSTIQNIIENTFAGHDVRLNEDKCSYIRKEVQNNVSFNYLGYKFIYSPTDGGFIYGIDSKKIEKFLRRYRKILEEYKIDKDINLFKARYEFLTSRVVFYNQFDIRKKKPTKWDVIGLSENYKELKNYIDVRNKIDQDTRKFLIRELVIIANQILPGEVPYFLKMPRWTQDVVDRNSYLPINRMKRNRSIVFHPQFGWSTEHLVKKIRELDSSILFESKSYPELVRIYCALIK